MSTQIERESLLTQLTSAFARKDNVQILKAMRADVDIEVPGESPLAGKHQGAEAVDRFLSALRLVFAAEGAPSEYHHAGNEMVLTQTLRARAALWEHHYRIVFDQDGRIERIVFEPNDVAGFDRLVKDALGDDPPASAAWMPPPGVEPGSTA